MRKGICREERHLGELLSGRGEFEMTENIRAQTARRQLEESELGRGGVGRKIFESQRALKAGPGAGPREQPGGAHPSGRRRPPPFASWKPPALGLGCSRLAWDTPQRPILCCARGRAHRGPRDPKRHHTPITCPHISPLVLLSSLNSPWIL